MAVLLGLGFIFVLWVWYDTPFRRPINASLLRRGMTRKEVRDAVGEPNEVTIHSSGCETWRYFKVFKWMDFLDFREGGLYEWTINSPQRVSVPLSVPETTGKSGGIEKPS